MKSQPHSKVWRRLSRAKSSLRGLSWRWFLGCLGSALLLLVVFYWTFCNMPRHSAQWTATRIDGAISNGLEYLARSGAFAKPLDQGGEHAMHHFLVDQVLERQPHALLRAQREYCNRANQKIPRWRSFNALPGWPKNVLNAAERAEIQMVIREYDNAYGRWLLWAVHASWAKLPAEDYRRLFRDTSLLKGSYDLTHALMAYWLVQRTAPNVAIELDVSERIAQVVRRIGRYTAWAPRCSDGYLERVALSLMIQPPPQVSRRWIERILTVQNADGGWTYVPQYWRTAQEMFGFRIATHRSHQHPSFLALVALAYYRDLLRAEVNESAPRIPRREVAQQDAVG